MGVDDTLIQEIVSRVVAVARPERIILFGSAANGQMTADSDIDLLVVADGSQNSLAKRLEIRRALRGLGYPFDVFLMERERFEESKEIFGGLAFPAHRNGRVIYEAA